MVTNSEYVKRSALVPETTVEFRLNLGTTLGDAVDITKYVSNLGNLTEKLTKSNIDVGGVILPNLNITLNNRSGKWNLQDDFFKNGFINKSQIKITTRYKQYIEDGEFSTDFNEDFAIKEGYTNITPEFSYIGLLKTTSCEWNRINFTFKTSLTSLSNLFKANQVQVGWLVTDSFSGIVNRMLNRTVFTKYLSIDFVNWEFGSDSWPGFDDTNICNNVGELLGKTVKEVLDKIMEITGSIYYINYDNEFIIEPVSKEQPEITWNIRGDDIIKVLSEKFNWAGQYTSFRWKREGIDIVVQMSFGEREQYQYDFREQSIDYKFITSSTAKRKEILTNLLELHKHLKKEVSIETKWNPDVIINSYVTLNVPEETIVGDKYLIWNKANHKWNAGKYWGLEQLGISFDSSVNWRVIEVKRNIEGERMTLKLKQVN